MRKLLVVLFALSVVGCAGKVSKVFLLEGERIEVTGEGEVTVSVNDGKVIVQSNQVLEADKGILNIIK